MKKLQAESIREMSIKEIQKKIAELEKKKAQIHSEEWGTSFPEEPSESIGTLKRNIARCKTILNERTNHRDVQA